MEEQGLALGLALLRDARSRSPRPERLSCLSPRLPWGEALWLPVTLTICTAIMAWRALCPFQGCLLCSVALTDTAQCTRTTQPRLQNSFKEPGYHGKVANTALLACLWQQPDWKSCNFLEGLLAECVESRVWGRAWFGLSWLRFASASVDQREREDGRPSSRPERTPVSVLL